MKLMKESFDPKKEVRKIKFVADKNPIDLLKDEKRRDAYNEFIEARKEQKEGITKLSAEIIDILTHNPDTPIGGIDKIVEMESEKMYATIPERFVGAKLHNALQEISSIEDEKKRDAEAVKLARKIIEAKGEKIKNEIFAQFRGKDQNPEDIFSDVRSGTNYFYFFLKEETKSAREWIENHKDLPWANEIIPMFKDQ